MKNELVMGSHFFGVRKNDWIVKRFIGLCEIFYCVSIHIDIKFKAASRYFIVCIKSKNANFCLPYSTIISHKVGY